MFEFKHIEHEQDGKKGKWWEQNKLERSDFVTLNGYESYISQSFKGLCISLAINEGAEQLEGSSFTCSNKMLLDLPPRLKKYSFPFFPINPKGAPPPAIPQQFLISRAQQKLSTMLNPAYWDSPKPMGYCIQQEISRDPRGGICLETSNRSRYVFW